MRPWAAAVTEPGVPACGALPGGRLGSGAAPEGWAGTGSPGGARLLVMKGPQRPGTQTPGVWTPPEAPRRPGASPPLCAWPARRPAPSLGGHRPGGCV